MGIDLGTSSVKIVVTDLTGHIQANSRQSYSTERLREEVEEQDANEWLKATITAIKMIDLCILQNIRSIAFTGQMHAVIPVDSFYYPLGKALLWFDHRAYLEAEKIRVKLNHSNVSRYTSIQPDETFPLAKLMWLHDHMKSEWNSIRYFLGAKDWLRCQFGGSAVTDHSEASGTQLFDEETWNWDSYLVNISGITVSQLPTIQSSISKDGVVSTTMSERTGLPAGCPLIVGGGDFPCVAGLVQLQSNDVLINIGTSCQVASIFPKENNVSKVTKFARVDQQGYLYFVPLLSFGMCIEWLSSIVNEDVYEKLACGLASHSSLLFLPQLTGERDWHPDRLYSGAFLGLTSKHGVDDFVSAVIQGMVMSVKEAYEIMQVNHEHHGRVIVTGTKSFTDALAIEIGSVLNSCIEVFHFKEPTAEGAALLAVRAISDVTKVLYDPHLISSYQVEPNMDKVDWYCKYYPLYKRARKINADILHCLLNNS